MGTVVELANHNRKLQGSNPATGNGREKMAINDLAYFGQKRKKVLSNWQKSLKNEKKLQIFNFFNN